MFYQPSVGVPIAKKVAFAEIGTILYVGNVWHYGVGVVIAPFSHSFTHFLQPTQLSGFLT